MATKKTAKKAKRKSRNRAPNATKSPVVRIPDERRYAHLSQEKDSAVIMAAAGASFPQIAKALSVSRGTVWRWFQEGEVAAALESEKESIHAEIRAGWMEIIQGARTVLAGFVRQGKKAPSALDAKAALQILKDSGYLPQSKEKKDQDKKRAQQLEAFVAGVHEILGDGVGDVDEPGE